jgi:Subtilisin inhibitor-like
VTRAPVVVAAVVSLLVVCSSSAAAPRSAETRLSIAVYPHGAGSPDVRRYRLSCTPVAGTVPRPARACRVLARLADPFRPTPAHTVCADIDLGPQEATVIGIVRGAAVAAHLTLRGSCEIERWRRVDLVVPGFPATG